MRVFLEHTQFWLYRFITNPFYRRFIFYSIFYGTKKRFAKANFSFNGLNIFAPDTLSFIWQYKEIFADQSYKFKTDSNKPIIYDCGANIGISCLYFSKNYPTAKVKAFEADPNIAIILKQNLKDNQIDSVELINKAVWINHGEIDISLEGSDGASIYSKKDIVKVECVRLKDLLESEDRVDLLKIDIEGAEYEVILDCQYSLKNVNNIFIEFHSFTNSPQKLSEILSILEKNNFRYFIKPVNDREIPFINRKNKSNPDMDLQLNIFGYR